MNQLDTLEVCAHNVSACSAYCRQLELLFYLETRKEHSAVMMTVTSCNSMLGGKVVRNSYDGINPTCGSPVFFAGETTFAKYKRNDFIILNKCYQLTSKVWIRPQVSCTE